MTITTNPSRDEYTATAGQTVFNYNFKIYANTDLNVYITPAGQVANDSTDLTTAYTVDPATIKNPAGGFITLTVGATLNDLVTIVSNIPSNRTTDYQTNGDFIPDTVNNDNDRTVSIAKQTEDALSRTLVLQESTQNPAPLTLPSPVPGNILQWKTDSSGLENVSTLPSDVVVSAFAQTYLDETTASDTRGVLDVPSVAESLITDNLYSFTDSGAADAYVLTSDSDNLVLTAYTDNLPLYFTTLNTSLTATPTINVDGLGVKNIKDVDGNNPAVGAVTGRMEMVYDGTDFRITNAGTTEIVGSIILRASANVPTGYLECDGSAVSRTTYAALFAEISTLYGIGDGSTTFNIPDLRGEFVRGWDNGRGVDSGRAIATAQADELESHTHDIQAGTSDGSGSFIDRSTNNNATGTTEAAGGSETRPRNIAMMYCIKF